MTNPQTNIADRIEKWRIEREAELRTIRSELIAQLRGFGIAEVIAEYEGYGDEGNIQDVTVRPAGLTPPEENLARIRDFAWAFAYHQHPGFENNEGGYGTLTWDIVADSITLDHANRYIECSHSCDEGL